MNRQARRALQKEQHKHLKSLKLTDKFVPMPRDQWPPISPAPEQIWRNHKYLVQLWRVHESPMDGTLRLSVCRTTLNVGGGWDDAMTWDELMQVKRQLGYGDIYAVEVYPRDRDVVNVANFRHLWLLPAPLPIGWFK